MARDPSAPPAPIVSNVEELAPPLVAPPRVWVTVHCQPKYGKTRAYCEYDESKERLAAYCRELKEVNNV